MILSRTSHYALRAAAFLANASEEDAVSIPVADIAEALDAPRNYLSKILHRLAGRGVLTSTRGPSGGFRLAVPPAEIQLIDLVDPADARATERECLLGGGICSDDAPCSAHEHWRELNDAVTRFLEETTLSDLTRREAAGQRA